MQRKDAARDSAAAGRVVSRPQVWGGRTPSLLFPQGKGRKLREGEKTPMALAKEMAVRTPQKGEWYMLQ